MAKLQPAYQNVQAHYDLSNDFFALFLDPSMTYSCAYFERDGMSLQEAQRAKIDLSLGKCDLHAGQRLLDVGCGWGATICRAAECFDVRCIGLTLSREQHAFAATALASLGEGVEVRLAGWEEFDEPVDRIISIGAFEHFREERYAAFFEKCARLLPADGRMLLHSIVWPEADELERGGIQLQFEDVQFLKFIGRRVFPGGQLRPQSVIRGYAERAGFRIARAQSLRPHYAQTLRHWLSNLQAARQRAIELTSQLDYDTYIHYLSGCERYFRSGQLDVVQLTCCKEVKRGKS